MQSKSIAAAALEPLMVVLGAATAAAVAARGKKLLVLAFFFPWLASRGADEDDGCFGVTCLGACKGDGGRGGRGGVPMEEEEVVRAGAGAGRLDAAPGVPIFSKIVFSLSAKRRRWPWRRTEEDDEEDDEEEKRESEVRPAAPETSF